MATIRLLRPNVFLRAIKHLEVVDDEQVYYYGCCRAIAKACDHAWIVDAKHEPEMKLFYKHFEPKYKEKGNCRGAYWWRSCDTTPRIIALTTCFLLARVENRRRIAKRRL